MRFHVAAVIYELRIPSAPIFDGDQEIWGQCIPEWHKLLISPAAPIDQRRRLLAHELYHAWRFEVPKPNTEEELATLSATVNDSMDEDLERQGGTTALRQLRPEPADPVFVPDQVGKPDLLGADDRMPCAGCDAYVMCGSIHHDPPEFHGATTRYRMTRWMVCDACGVLQVWLEWCSPDGTPSGKFVANPRPRLLWGHEASAWLAEHRAGVATC